MGIRSAIFGYWSTLQFSKTLDLIQDEDLTVQVGRKLTDKFEFLAETHISSPFMLGVTFGFTFMSVQMQQTKYSFAQNNCNKHSVGNFQTSYLFLYYKRPPYNSPLLPFAILKNIFCYKLFNADAWQGHTHISRYMVNAGIQIAFQLLRVSLSCSIDFARVEKKKTNNFQTGWVLHGREVAYSLYFCCHHSSFI